MNRTHVFTIFMMLVSTFSHAASSTIHTQHDLLQVCEEIKIAQQQLTKLREEVNQLLHKIQSQEAEISLQKQKDFNHKADWLFRSTVDGGKPLAGFIFGISTLPIFSGLLSTSSSKKRKKTLKGIKPLEIKLKTSQEKYAHTETVLHELLVQKQELEHSLRLAIFAKKTSH